MDLFCRAIPVEPIPRRVKYAGGVDGASWTPLSACCSQAWKKGSRGNETRQYRVEHSRDTHTLNLQLLQPGLMHIFTQTKKARSQNENIQLPVASWLVGSSEKLAILDPTI